MTTGVVPYGKFRYVEPTIEELNRRIATGQTFVQSAMSGTYEEYYQPNTPVPGQYAQVVTGGGEVAPAEMTTWIPDAVPQSRPGGIEGFLGEILAPGGAKPGQLRSAILSASPLMGAGLVVSPLTKALVTVAPQGAKLPALIAGVGALAAGGGAGALLTALGVSSTALALMSLIPGAGEWLGGGGRGGLIKTGGGVMTTGMQVDNATSLQGVPFGGPGVPEPPAGMVSKAWKTKSFSNAVGEYWVYHWSLLDGRRLTWNAAKKQAKIWRPGKNITLGPKPRVKDLIRINKQVDRLNRGLKKQLKRAHVDLS